MKTNIMTPDIYNAKTSEELQVAIEAAFPDELEIEPGKIAVYDPDRGCWIYHGSDGLDMIIHI